MCSIGSSDIDIDITGSPCQDYSPAGLRQGSTGPRFPIFYAWIQSVRHLQPRVLVHENVLQFPVSLLSELLSDLYVIEVLHVECGHTGMLALSRERQYSILYHRNKVRIIARPAEIYVWLAQQICAYNVLLEPDNLFVASQTEIEAEIMQQAARHGDPFFNNFSDSLAVRNALLTEGEQGRLTRYEEKLDPIIDL